MRPLSTSLTFLANKYGSDKGSLHSSKHKYTYIYDLAFSHLRDNPINILEMGLAVGGPEVGLSADRCVDSPSVSMWLEYFRHANIYGFDISDFSHIEDPRFHFFRGDSGSRDDLQKLANIAPSFDLIIDDASHASYHQQLALKFLFPRLSLGGLYIIEDLQWQSPFFEEKLPHVPKTSEWLKSLFENDLYTQNDLIDEADALRIRSECSSFSAFGPLDEAGDRATKLVILKKASNPAYNRL